jgi:hypothetical protein
MPGCASTCKSNQRALVSWLDQRARYAPSVNLQVRAKANASSETANRLQRVEGNIIK